MSQNLENLAMAGFEVTEGIRGADKRAEFMGGVLAHLGVTD